VEDSIIYQSVFWKGLPFPQLCTYDLRDNSRNAYYLNGLNSHVFLNIDLNYDIKINENAVTYYKLPNYRSNYDYGYDYQDDCCGSNKVCYTLKCFDVQYIFPE